MGPRSTRVLGNRLCLGSAVRFFIASVYKSRARPLAPGAWPSAQRQHVPSSHASTCAVFVRVGASDHVGDQPVSGGCSGRGRCSGTRTRSVRGASGPHHGAALAKLRYVACTEALPVADTEANVVTSLLCVADAALVLVLVTSSWAFVCCGPCLGPGQWLSG